MTMTDKPTRRKRRTPRMDVARKVPSRYQAMMDAIEDGTFTLDMLDEEEILRGRLRNKNGDFTGRAPAMIPQALAVEMVRRQRQILMEDIAPATKSAIKRLRTSVEAGTTVHDGPAVQAAKLLMQYGLGNPVDKVEINVQGKVEHYGNVVVGSTIAVRAIESGEIVDAEIVEDEL